MKAGTSSNSLDWITALAATLGVLVLGAAVVFLPHAGGLSFLGDPSAAKRWVLMIAATLAAFLIAPALRSLPGWARGRWFSLALLPGCAIFFCWFVFHFGNRQFGAWDYNIIIDTGWRQMLGQRPYVDFITPNPPLFNLGIYLGFKAFGLSWNAQIATIAVYCVATFVWIYWLMRRLQAEPLLALAMACSAETVTVLAVCFWWYNGTTELIAVVFLLSALVCARAERAAEMRWPGWRRGAVWCSYAGSLGLLLLAKPNIAGLMAVLLIPLLLIAARQRLMFAVATIAGFAVSGAILLLDHISVPALVASYRGAAIERGGLHFFGVNEWTRHEKYALLGWVVALALPLLWLLPSMWRHLRKRRFAALAYELALVAPALVALYGMLTNAEIKESETAILLISVAIVCFVRKDAPWPVRRFFAGLTLGAVMVSLYTGAVRGRVYGIGPGMFFEAGRATQRLSDPFFKDLHTTERMVRVQNEVHDATARFPGKTFLGPRLEYDYAVLRLPSPRGWPVYYQPGTSFARHDEQRVDAGWKAQRFQTLIFLGDDRTFYGQDLLDAIAQGYRREPGYQEIQVYTRR